MKILINKTDKNILPITKIYDLGSVTTTIDDLLNQSTITLEKNITPILSIDGSNYLINNFNPTNIKEDFEAIITESDLIPFGGGTGGDSRPYKVYTALLTQSGTNAPVATVLENTLGNVTYSKIITGFFTATTSFVLPNEKTFISISNSVANTGDLSINLVNKNTNNNNQIYIETYNSSGVRTDSTILQNIMYFEIRIYN